MIRTLVLLFFVVGCSAAAEAQVSSGEARTVAPSGVERFTLPNGLEVMLQPVPGRRFAALVIRYRVGARDVPRGWTGLAHVAEHAMFSGTDTLDAVAVGRLYDAAGAVLKNAETAADSTVYYALLPGDALEWALYVESQRMARTLAGLTEERFERQQEVVLSEGWETGRYGWRGLLARMLAASTYGETHPYSLVLEERADVEAIRLRHVQWFLQQHYRPERAVVSIVGGFDVATVRASVERYFGPVVAPAGPPASRVAPAPVATLEGERRITLDVPSDRDRLVVAWPTPPWRVPMDAELDVVASIVEARMRNELFGRGILYEWSASHPSMELGSTFQIEAAPMPGHDVDELLAAIDTILDEIRREPPSDALVARIAESLAAHNERNTENLLERARLLAGSSADDLITIEAIAARYRSVTRDSVRNAIATWLPAHRRVVVMARANDEVHPAGRVRADRATGSSTR